MLLWILLFGGLALAASAVGLLLAMGRSERRARRLLFRALGLDEATVDLLMARGGDVMAELALVRRQDLTATSHLEPEPDADDAAHGQPAIRLVHPSADAPAATHAPPPGDRPGERRRLRLPGREGRL